MGLDAVFVVVNIASKNN